MILAQNAPGMYIPPPPPAYQMRSITHFSLYFNLLCRQPILTHYACFGLSYFYYDIVVMFIGTCLEEKHENPQGHLHYTHVWSKLYKKKKLIIIHHLLLPIFGFPAITVSFSYKNNSIWNQPNLVNNQKDELECSVRKFAWLFPQESYIKLMCRKENQINNKNIAWNIKCWNPGHIENPTFVFTKTKFFHLSLLANCVTWQQLLRPNTSTSPSLSKMLDFN